MPRYISVNSALQAHPEFLNEQIDDHDKAIYAKGWNACNSAYHDAIKEIDSVSPDEVRGGGEWISKTMSVPNGHGQTYNRWGCSVCKAKFKQRTNYCPNCGAMMKEVKQ